MSGQAPGGPAGRARAPAASEYGVRMPEYGVRMPEYGVRIPEYGVRMPEYDVRIRPRASAAEALVVVGACRAKCIDKGGGGYFPENEAL